MSTRLCRPEGIFGASSFEIEDQASIQAWQEFLTRYAAGEYGSETTPSMPFIPARLVRPHDPNYSPAPWAFSNAPLYSSSTDITLDNAREIRDYYCANHYLPPPRSPLESRRHACIAGYDLYSAKQLANIQAATEVIAAFFPHTLCTFSLFHDHIQKHYCPAGNTALIEKFGIVPGLRIPAEDSLCGHAVLHEDSLFFVNDLKHDWRYLNNPFVFAGFQSFIGCSVSLAADPLRDDAPRIVVGTLNVCFIEDSIDELSLSQRRVLRHVTTMLETQLRATWEGDQRTKEGRARMALSDLIETALVDIKLDAETEEGDRSISSKALERLCQVLPDMDNIVLLSSGGVEMAGKYIAGIGTPSEVLAFAGKPSQPIPQQTLLDIINSNPSPTVFHAGQALSSGLESYLDPLATSHLILPFHSADRPFYVMIASSSTPHYSFPAADINIIRSIGSVLRARAVQHNVMIADAAKTSFLSSISHELRTPMHGVKASLELIRKSVDGEEWDEVEGPLSLAESSGRALLNILNDVLDFGKNDWAKAEETQVDLAQSAREIASVCLAHSGENMGEEAEVRFEYEDRDWNVMVNEAKYHRIIMNGLTNAMKFCSNGEITISLRTTPNRQACIMQIQDHGIGIDAEALPRLMQPFTKMDTDSPGAGLGLYITKAIVEKLGGDLILQSIKGKGTTFIATFPVTLLHLNPGEAPIIVTDLRPAKRFRSNGTHGSAPPTPQKPPRRESVTTFPKASPRAPTISLADDPFDPLRILVIDDNDICRKLLRMAFKRASVSITTLEAENGQIGLDLFSSFRPDIVFTDVSMPVMDGVTAAGRMREMLDQEEPRECRIYALTGLGSSDPRTQSMGVNGKAAMDGWLVKGKDMLDKVYNILQEVMENRQGNPLSSDVARKGDVI